MQSLFSFTILPSPPSLPSLPSPLRLAARCRLVLRVRRFVSPPSPSRLGLPVGRVRVGEILSVGRSMMQCVGWGREGGGRCGTLPSSSSLPLPPHSVLSPFPYCPTPCPAPSLQAVNWPECQYRCVEAAAVWRSCRAAPVPGRSQWRVGEGQLRRSGEICLLFHIRNEIFIYPIFIYPRFGKSFFLLTGCVHWNVFFFFSLALLPWLDRSLARVGRSVGDDRRHRQTPPTPG